MVRRRRRVRVLDSVDDRVCDRSVVDLLDAVLRDQVVRVREVRVAEGRAHVVRRAVRVEVERSRRRYVVEPRHGLLCLIEERLVDYEPVARNVDRRLEHLRKRHRPVLLQREVPGRRRAGDSDGQPAPARVVERQRLAGRGVDERRTRHRLGRRLASVDRRDLAVRGADDHEAPAAQAARERLGHAEHGRRRDGRVDGVAAVFQRVDGRLGRERLDARGGATCARRCRRAGRCHGCGCRNTEEQRNDEKQKDGESAHDSSLGARFGGGRVPL
jgi:hypothetical protein